MYGLEALVLQKPDIEQLEVYHRKNLRYIQHLPQSTATPAIHLLIGIPPVEALINIRALTLFYNIVVSTSTSPPATYIRNLVKRQLAIKDLASSSWASHIKRLLHVYDLPTPYSAAGDFFTKSKWKEMVKSAVNGWWTSELARDAEEMTTLCYLHLPMCSASELHPVWQNLKNPLSVQKATVRAQLLVRRYPLATSKTAGSKRADRCPLCNGEPETVTHFLLHCPMLRSERRPYLESILHTCRIQGIPVEPDHLVKIILDSNHLPYIDESHDELCQNMVFKLHNRRGILLGGGSAYTLARRFS